MITTATVTKVPSNKSNIVEVSLRNTPNDTKEKMPATVPTYGDILLPTEGAGVIVLIVNQFLSIVTDVYYDPREDEQDIPDYEAGERVLAHGASDTRVRFTSDGSVEVKDTPTSEAKSVLTASGTRYQYHVAGRRPEIATASESSETTLKTS